MWPLFARDFAVLLGIFGNGIQPILARSSMYHGDGARLDSLVEI